MNKKIICHDINGGKIEVDSNKLIFSPSVYGILIENNKILLSKQWDGYDFPGGKIEIYETINQALKREFFEETGITVEPIKPLLCETSFFHQTNAKENKYRNCPLIYFLVKKISGTISTKNLSKTELNYVGEAEWIDVNKINDLKIYTPIDSIKLIKHALNN